MRLGSGSLSRRLRTFGGSLPPPVVSAADLRAEIAFEGGLCGRALLRATLGSSPSVVNARSFVRRDVGTLAVLHAACLVSHVRTYT